MAANSVRGIRQSLPPGTVLGRPMGSNSRTMAAPVAMSMQDIAQHVANFSGAVTSQNGASVGSAVFVTAPVNHTDNGTTGMVATDGTYFYVCIASNSWKRVMLASW